MHHLIELKALIQLCRERGIGQASAVLSPWDGEGHVLLVKFKKETYMLRVKHNPQPRVFKKPNIAFNIIEELGFSSATVIIGPQNIKFKPTTKAVHKANKTV